MYAQPDSLFDCLSGRIDSHMIQNHRITPAVFCSFLKCHTLQEKSAFLGFLCPQCFVVQNILEDNVADLPLQRCSLSARFGILDSS